MCRPIIKCELSWSCWSLLRLKVDMPNTCTLFSSPGVALGWKLHAKHLQLIFLTWSGTWVKASCQTPAPYSPHLEWHLGDGFMPNTCTLFSSPGVALGWKLHAKHLHLILLTWSGTSVKASCQTPAPYSPHLEWHFGESFMPSTCNLFSSPGVALGWKLHAKHLQLILLTWSGTWVMASCQTPATYSPHLEWHLGDGFVQYGEGVHIGQCPAWKHLWIPSVTKSVGHTEQDRVEEVSIASLKSIYKNVYSNWMFKMNV